MEEQAKRRQLRKGARREAILAVAARAFLEKGYSAISLSAIAAEVGGSKATLWRHFRSKAELFEAVLERETESFRRDVEQALGKNRSFRAALRDFCIAYMTMLNSDDAVALHRLVIAEAWRFPELGEIFFERGPELVTRALAQAIAAASVRGELGPCEPDVMARYITAMCLSDRFQKTLFGVQAPQCSADFASEAERIVDIVISALSAGRDPGEGKRPKGTA